jgi:hypothetical protein
MSKRAAICIRGAVAKKSTRFVYENQLYTRGQYVNFTAVRNAIQRHIIDCNPSVSFDFYIHCWSTDLEDPLVKLYAPVKWKFEDNRVYNDRIKQGIPDASRFGQLSSVLSMGKALELIEKPYDHILLVRPDVLLWKDMILSEYDQTHIYVNRWIEERGDFHFVMSPQHLEVFKSMFSSVLNRKSAFFGEGWIKQYLLDNGFPLKSDNIHAGVHQEVLRQIKLTSVDRHKIHPSFFTQYGLSLQDIEEANVC